MSYRSLMVLLDADKSCASRTDYAIGLARAMDAHLVGLAPTGVAELPLVVGATAALGAYMAEAADALRQQAEQSVRTFRAACDRAGLRSVETVVVEDTPEVALLRHAAACDLTVLSQPDPGDDGRVRERAVVDQSVLNSPRPTLLVPYAGRFTPPPSRVLLAWDEGREAARAAADAMPLLLKAQSVELLRWTRDPEDDPALPQRLDATARWLLWHGVKAEPRVEVSSIGIADAMLSRAADLDADLIVMGAYGHARWTQRMVGGATRGILETMTVPVLMSR